MTTKSGATFPRGATDWKFMFSDLQSSPSPSRGGSKTSTSHNNRNTNNIVPHTLSGLYRQGYLVVVFSNQGAIRSNVTGKKAVSVQTMMDDVFRTVRVEYKKKRRSAK